MLDLYIKSTEYTYIMVIYYTDVNPGTLHLWLGRISHINSPNSYTSVFRLLCTIDMILYFC